MTDEEAERILNPKTTLDAYAESEYYGGFSGAEKWKADVDEACVVAVSALRERIERNNGCEVCLGGEVCDNDCYGFCDICDIPEVVKSIHKTGLYNYCPICGRKLAPPKEDKRENL